jgi:hypothetical protein
MPPTEGVGAVLLREAVEGVLSSEVARHAIATALEVSHKPFPITLDEVRAFVRGPLARHLRSAGLDDEAGEITGRLASLLARATMAVAEAQAFDDDEPTRPVHRLSLRPVAQPALERVRVLVLATGTALADTLRASPRGESLALLCVATEAALTGALHAGGPLVVVIDAGASDVDETSLVEVLRARPSQLSVLITGADLPHGACLLHALTRAGVDAIGVVRAQGVESLAEMLVRERK